MSQYARLLFCSTPSYITPHPSPGSFPTAIYTSPIISFSVILDVYMFTGAIRQSYHPLYMPHSGICPQITPTLANLPPSLFTRCHGSVPFLVSISFPAIFLFNLFACFNTFAGAGLILPPSPRRCSVRRASPAAPYCAFCGLICPHATPEHRRMRHIQSRNTSLIVLWHI